MTTFRITYRPGSAKGYEDIEAERVDVEGSNGLIVLRNTVLVMNRPREVVVRRLPGADVLCVEQVEPTLDQPVQVVLRRATS